MKLEWTDDARYNYAGDYENAYRVMPKGNLWRAQWRTPQMTRWRHVSEGTFRTLEAAKEACQKHYDQHNNP